MCRAAHAVCPNSERIAKYLESEAGCNSAKITVVPNATRAGNIPPRPLLAPGPAPSDIADLPRPIVGVIGNFAANVDWRMLRDAIAQSRGVSWVFVGPCDTPIPDRKLTAERRNLMRLRNRVRFLGLRPYASLCEYARSFDAALIPYANVEPAICGSSTRFYEHLAACRPILASRAHHELRDQEPLLKLVSSGTQLAAEIGRLRECGFEDGYEELRWLASRHNTWRQRADCMVAAAERSLEQEHL